MSRIGFLAYGAGVTGITLLFGPNAIDSTTYLFEQTHAGMTPIAAVSWVLSTFGPLSLSVIVWLIAKRVNVQWLLHLIFIPVAVVIFRTAGAAFFDATGVSGDSMMDAFALIAGGCYLLLAIVVHFAALAVIGGTSVKRRVNGI